jgi:hypothetical protein
MTETFQTELPYHETGSNPSVASSSKFPTLKPSSHDPHISSSISVSTTSTTTTTVSPPSLYQPPVRLPTSVNIIALREAFLSEAPFVTNKNRIYWRRMIDHFNYQNLLAISFHILSDCITENSIIDLYKLNSSLTSMKLINNLSTNLAEMFFNIKLKERDIFFSKLSEILTYMIVNALRTSYPKHHRICQSIKFREILLDWFNEVLSGIRNTNCRINCEWLFQDIYDVPILTTTTSSSNHITSSSSSTSVSLHNGNGNTSSSSSLTGAAAAAAAVIGTANATTAASAPALSSKKKKLNSSAYSPHPSPSPGSSSNSMANGIVRSKYTISLSPLINLYTGQSLAKKSEVSMSLSLSHSVSRPLTTLSCETAADGGSTSGFGGGTSGGGIVLGRLKGKTLDYEQVKLLIRNSKEKRREILLEHKKNIKDANRDIGKYKVRYKKTLKALEQTDRGAILAMHSGGTTAAPAGTSTGGVGGTQQMSASAVGGASGGAGAGGGLGSTAGSSGGNGSSSAPLMTSGGVGMGSPMKREENVNM